jgi:hypothetical protein
MIHVLDTQLDRVVDNVGLFHAPVTMPRTAYNDAATIVAQSLMHALPHPAPATPFSTIGTIHL